MRGLTGVQTRPPRSRVTGHSRKLHSRSHWSSGLTDWGISFKISRRIWFVILSAHIHKLNPGWSCSKPKLLFQGQRYLRRQSMRFFQQKQKIELFEYNARGGLGYRRKWQRNIGTKQGKEKDTNIRCKQQSQRCEGSKQTYRQIRLISPTLGVSLGYCQSHTPQNFLSCLDHASQDRIEITLKEPPVCM